MIMAKRIVECEVNELPLKGAHGTVDGVEVICPRCGNRATSYGTGEASITRCFAILKNGCLLDEDNEYVEEE